MLYGLDAVTQLLRPISKNLFPVFLVSLAILETITNIEQYSGQSFFSRTVAYGSAALATASLGARQTR